jgi:hypothetical protein
MWLFTVFRMVFLVFTWRRWKYLEDYDRSYPLQMIVVGDKGRKQVTQYAASLNSHVCRINQGVLFIFLSSSPLHVMFGTIECLKLQVCQLIISCQLFMFSLDFATRFSVFFCLKLLFRCWNVC